MSPQDCRDRAEQCERQAKSFSPSDRMGETWREAAAQWRRLADSDEAYRSGKEIYPASRGVAAA